MDLRGLRTTVLASNFEVFGVPATAILPTSVPDLVAAGLLPAPYGHWPLDEVSGVRARVLGAAPDLAEVGGVVSSAAGRLARAASSTEADTFALDAAVAVPMAAGLTLSFWFQWPAWSSGSSKSIWNINNGVDQWIYIARFFSSDFLEVGLSWAAGAGNKIGLPLPRLGAFGIDLWHLFVLTYDAATGVLTGMVDAGSGAAADVWSGPDLPALKLQATVPGASLAAVNALVFSDLKLLKAFSGSYVNIEGRMAEASVWPQALTADQIALLYPAVDTKAIWLTPQTEPTPTGSDFRRSEARRGLALRSDHLPTVPRGTLIQDPADGSQWRVDGTDRVDDTNVRVSVVPYGS